MVHCIGDVVNQRYRILGILGEGGTGITYSAQDQNTNQKVAIKTLSLRQAEDWKTVELFEREAKTLEQLQHPNIPKYLNYFVVEDERDRFFYLVQELAEGKSLFRWVQEDWRCTEKEVKEIAVQVLNILEYLHSFSSPVIHRDIKPQNLIRRTDGQLFLVDFGAVGSTYHNTFMRGSTMVGTFGYMAPEQFRGQALPATDFYGLGATLLFLLTRRSPAELPTQKLKVEFRSRIQVSDGLSDWIEKALEPSAKDRFESVHEARKSLLKTAISRYQIPREKILWILIGLMTFITFPAINSHKYFLINRLNLSSFAAHNISEGKTNIQEYLDNGGDPNIKSNGLPLIHTAIRSANIENVKALVAKGVNLQATGKEGTNPLHEAVNVSYSEGDRNIINYLLSLNKIDLSVKDKQGKTPLDYLEGRAPQYGQQAAEAISEYLIPDKPFKNNREKLIDQLINISLKNDWLSIAGKLQLKTRKQNNDLAHKILDQSLEKGDVTTLNLFISENKNLSKHFFVGDKQKKLFEILKLDEYLKLFPNVNQVDKDGNTVLNYVSHNIRSAEEIEKIRLLIQKGANTNKPNAEGVPPLISALTSNYSIGKLIQEAAIILISNGANPNYRFPSNIFKDASKRFASKTVLQIAAASCSSAIMQSLLSHGADVTLEDIDGNTALHEAVFNTDLEVAKSLIKAGANIKKRNKEGLTPIDLTYKEYVSPAVAQYLRTYAASLHYVSSTRVSSATQLYLQKRSRTTYSRSRRKPFTRQSDLKRNIQVISPKLYENH
jgi:serine/threonine protein kinase